MDDIFMSLILLWPSDKIPDGYLACRGQKLPIQGNQQLFSLIGTTFGGDGIEYFRLPDLQTRVPVGSGQGPSLSPRTLGSHGGEELVGITYWNIPVHSHSASKLSVTVKGVKVTMPDSLKVNAYVPVNAGPGSSSAPGEELSFAQAPDTEAALGAADNIYGPADTGGASIPLSVNIPGGQFVSLPGGRAYISGVTGDAGGNFPHENRQPYVVLNYIISVDGSFPSRS